MDLHDSLLAIVLSGGSEPSQIHSVECDNGHICGYAKLPLGSVAWPISVICHICHAAARVSGPIQMGKPRPAEKPHEPVVPAASAISLDNLAKLSDEDLSSQFETAPKDLRSAILKIKSSRSLARARKIKEDRFLLEMAAMSERVNQSWEQFCEAKPPQADKALDELISQNPYGPKAIIEPTVLFTAFWLAWELWGQRFVSKLAAAWHFPSEQALRSRADSIWTWLDASVRAKMPFMVKALRAPKQAEKALKKATNKTPNPEEPAEEKGETEALILEMPRPFTRPPPVEKVKIPVLPDEDVIGLMRGKRVLIAGGQGAREPQRLTIEKTLQLEQLEWVHGERNKPSRLTSLADNLRPGKYDYVMLLARFLGHYSDKLTRACRTTETPVIYLPNGYGVKQVIEAIRQQILPRPVERKKEQAG